MSASTHTFYKYFFLYIEPFFTILGTYYSLYKQQSYLDLTHLPSSPQTGIPLSTQIVLTQLANMYFCVAINEALVLRASSDLKVWRTVLICLLCADFGHLYSVSAVGWRVYWDVLGWNAIDWGNVAFVYVGATTRICFLSGLGVGPKGGSAVRRSTRRKRPSARITG